MARPRSKKYQGLPPNLHYDKVNKLFKFYRHDTKRYYSLGNDRTKAVAAAKQLNSILMPGYDLVAKVLGTNSTLSVFINERFLNQILPEQKLSKNTLRDYNNKFRVIHKEIGSIPIDEITVKDISKFLSKFPATQSNRYRSLLSVIFKYAVAEGLAEQNPAAMTLNRKVIKARNRLSYEEYQKIYHLAEPWLQNAMDIGLLSLQRREDIVNMKFSDIKDGYLYVIQQKTEKHGSSAYIKIKIGESLKNILNRCRDDIVSPYLIHRLPERNLKSDSKNHHTQVTPDYLSKQFMIVRDQTELFCHLLPLERPTFHEIRSLGIKLYEDAGFDAQFLAGHTNRKMTEQYKVGHGIEWTIAEANLKI